MHIYIHSHIQYYVILHPLLLVYTPSHTHTLSLSPDLSKPASTLYLHNLTGTLEAAIRATNAQYEPTDILHRLDVRMLDLSPGDRGWDVFSLHYHVDGPIGTVSIILLHDGKGVAPGN